MRLLLALLVISCAPPQPRNAVTVDVRERPLTMRFAPDLSMRDRALVFSAADEWRIATGGALASVFDDSGEVLVRPDSEIKGGRYSEGLIRLEPGRDPRLTRAFALHEIGHAFGLDHLWAGVMSTPVTIKENCIDAAAVWLACSAYPCTQPRETCRR